MYDEKYRHFSQCENSVLVALCVVRRNICTCRGIDCPSVKLRYIVVNACCLGDLYVLELTRVYVSTYECQ